MKYSLFFTLLLLGSCTLIDQGREAPSPVSQDTTTFSGYASIPPLVSGESTGSLSDISQSGVILSGSDLSYTGERTPIGAPCMQDVCIDMRFPYFEDADSWVQIFGEDTTTQKVQYLESSPGKDSGEYLSPFFSGKILEIKKDYTYAKSQTLEEMGGSGVIYTKPHPGLIVKLSYNNGCFRAYKEEFFDIHGKKISNPSSLLGAPEKIDLGNIVLTADWSVASELTNFGMKFNDRETPARLDPVSLKSDYKNDILSQIRQMNGQGTFTRYVLEFREIPGIIFYYKSNLPSSEGVISLSLNSQDIDSEGNIISEEKTRDILKLYSSDFGERKLWRSIRLKGRQDDYTGITYDTFLPEMLPIFRVVKLQGNTYLLYPSSKYEGFTSAELCKPLVYVYDRDKRKNTLRVEFPRGGSFTRIIPDFSSSNAWDFSADSAGEIRVGDMTQSFGYLYYSAKVPNYTYNTHGWQLYGRDIESFFDEKLDIIGFNEKEKKDFIEYWIGEFELDTLYFVSFKFDEALDTYVTLDFAYKPTRQMRVLLEAYPLKEKNTRFLWPDVGTRFDATLLRSFVRSGKFDVFEWGGTVQKSYNGEIIIR